MISTVDKLLLNADQQARLEEYTRAYSAAKAAGDRQGMDAAHLGAEQVRASAGYSGGSKGDRFELLQSASGPTGFDGYQSLVNNYANSGMKAIAEGYADQMAQLDQQRTALEAQGAQNQAAARSAAWGVQRLAADGLLTHGIENTGIADAITATALNQAAANAYRALLDHQQDLNENSAARTSARAEAAEKAANLQKELGTLMGDAYQAFYEKDAERRDKILFQQMNNDAESALQQMKNESETALQQLKAESDAALLQMKNEAELAKQEKDYYYTLALQQLQRQWELEDQAKGL